MNIFSTPEWLGAGLLTAALAAVGYVLKLIIEGAQARARDRQRTQEERRARLVELLSLLRAGYAVFQSQAELRDKLMSGLPRLAGDAQPPTGEGYEAAFTAAYQTLTPAHRELHRLIRAYSEHGLYPINRAVLDWLRADTHFKAQRGEGARGRLAGQLAQLEAHLTLWLAKYAVWIPDQPAHALVYLADEQRHGVGFPRGIEASIEQVLAET